MAAPVVARPVCRLHAAAAAAWLQAREAWFRRPFYLPPSSAGRYGGGIGCLPRWRTRQLGIDHSMAARREGGVAG